MTVSCGTILFDRKQNGFLACHSTGKKFEQGTFDIPKGHMEDGESSLQTAVREMREETGINISGKEFSGRMQFIGPFSYVKGKDLELYWLDVALPDMKLLHCDSMFRNEFTGQMMPEVNGYAMVHPDSTIMLFPSLKRIIDRILLDRIPEKEVL